jgi:hypothetical protein
MGAGLEVLRNYKVILTNEGIRCPSLLLAHWPLAIAFSILLIPTKAMQKP